MPKIFFIFLAMLVVTMAFLAAFLLHAGAAAADEVRQARQRSAPSLGYMRTHLHHLKYAEAAPDRAAVTSTIAGLDLKHVLRATGPTA